MTRTKVTRGRTMYIKNERGLTAVEKAFEDDGIELEKMTWGLRISISDDGLFSIYELTDEEMITFISEAYDEVGLIDEFDQYADEIEYYYE